MAGLRRAPASLVLFGALALAGCGGLSAGPASPLPDHAQALDAFAAIYAPGRVGECLALPVPQQQSCRDTISYALMTAIDLRYATFEADFFDKTRYGSFVGRMTQIGLAGAASVTSPLATANLLAALAAGAGAAQEAFSRDVLAERTSAALMTAMRTERARLVLRIRMGLQSRPEDYPLGWALSDLYAYYRAGTVPGALSALTRAVGADAQLAQDNVTLQALTGATPILTPGGGSAVMRTDAAGRRSIQATGNVLAVPPPAAGPPPPAPAPGGRPALVPRAEPTAAEAAARQCLLRAARDPATAGPLAELLRTRGLATAGDRVRFLTDPQFAAERVPVAARFCEPGQQELRPPAPSGAAAPSPAAPAGAAAPSPAAPAGAAAASPAAAPAGAAAASPAAAPAGAAIASPAAAPTAASSRVARMLPHPDPTPTEAAATQCLLRAFHDATAGPVLAAMLRGRALTSRTQQARFLTHPDAAAGRVELAARFCGPGQAELRPGVPSSG